MVVSPRRPVAGGRRRTGPADPPGLYRSGSDRLRTLPGGSWQVWVEVGRSVGSAAVTAPGPPVTVPLGPAATLEITVPALEGSETVAEAELLDAAGRPFQRSGWGVTSSRWKLMRGSGRITGLPAGTWTVRVTTPDGRTWTGTATTAPGADARLVLE